MTANKFNFTSQRLNKIIPPTSGRTEFFDTQQHGLCLRITATGKKTFRLNVWDKNTKRPVRETVGEYPIIPINTAREIVQKKVVELAEGIDIEEKRKLIRQEMHFGELFEYWLNNYAIPADIKHGEEVRRYELYIESHFSKKKVSSISTEDIAAWRVKMLKTNKVRGAGTLSSSTVDRALILLSSIFSNGAPKLENPCVGVKRGKPVVRTQYLKSDYLTLFFDGLEDAKTPSLLRDYLLVLLFTGQRRTSVLSMQWAHLDLSQSVWLVPGGETKNKEMKMTYIPTEALKILKRRKDENPHEKWVFPSPRQSTSGHFSEPKKSWKSLLSRCGLPNDFRLHDLRRTMGSWQAMTGASQQLIGDTLGHKSEQSTKHYTHFANSAVADAMERAIAEMKKQGGS